MSFYLLLILHLIICVLLAVYGLHRYVLVYLYYKYARSAFRSSACFLQKPTVTVQLPMYNEHSVAERVIEAACSLDWPRDRLEIQVLDDSTDPDAVRIVRDVCDRMRGKGHAVQLLHRTCRDGFKAGALEAGLHQARGEFLVVFDADFVPPSDILHALIDPFTDPAVGMVQARWTHLNREDSLLTRTQAVLLDGHFVIEHTARNRSGRFMSFNGTAGAWRRQCIADAGGWQHDTLTEDLDLSYRAQLAGWRFAYLPDVVSPAEVPPEMAAFKGQQHRWAKGGAQTCRKLLPTILRSGFPWRVKLEAFFHLTSWVSYFLMVLLTLLLLPVLYCKEQLFGGHTVMRFIVDGSLVLLATCSAGTFFVASQREIGQGWWESLRRLPFVMSLGVGISLNNARAALEGLLGHQSEFIRTPKYGDGPRTARRTWEPSRDTAARPAGWFAGLNGKLAQAVVEACLAAYLVLCAVYAAVNGLWVGLFFLVLFAIGYCYVAGLTFWILRRQKAVPLVAPVV